MIHGGGNSVPSVEAALARLRHIGAVAGQEGNEEVVHLLAEAGAAGHCTSEALDDVQLRTLRDIFEHLDEDVRPALARQVGLAIRIDAYFYGDQAQIVPTTGRPPDLYLPRAIDRDPDTFAFGADNTSGLLWCHPRYAVQLSTARGGTGLGPYRFLALLGARRYQGPPLP